MVQTSRRLKLAEPAAGQIRLWLGSLRLTGEVALAAPARGFPCPDLIVGLP
jgi:hypothetical protein